jgi:energy-coupling factor transporter transmembrane protein EcfT
MDKANNFLENLKQNKLTDIDWSSFFSWEYLTDPSPSEVFLYEQWIYVVVLLNLTLFVIFFRFVSRFFVDKKPKFRFVKRISFMWLINTILLLFYNIVRTEGVKFLAMRLFLLIILFGYIGIFIYALFYCIRLLPSRMDSYKQAKIRSKYSKKQK